MSVFRRSFTLHTTRPAHIILPPIVSASIQSLLQLLQLQSSHQKHLPLCPAVDQLCM